jgi:hypothetical protein
MPKKPERSQNGFAGCFIRRGFEANSYAEFSAGLDICTVIVAIEEERVTKVEEAVQGIPGKFFISLIQRLVCVFFFSFSPFTAAGGTILNENWLCPHRALPKIASSRVGVSFAGSSFRTHISSALVRQYWGSIARYQNRIAALMEGARSSAFV